MMNKSQDPVASFQAGQAKGQTQEKGSQMIDNASNAAQSAKESYQQAGQQMMTKAEGVTAAVKDKVEGNNGEK